MRNYRIYTKSKPSDKSLLIAFCGVDGSGKSTIIEGLKKDAILPSMNVLKNRNHRVVRQVMMETIYRKNQNWKDYIEGGFSHGSAIANALDFLLYYENVIQPMLMEDLVIVCDRYALCSAAYMHAVGLRELAEDLYYGIRPPDLTIVLKVEPDLMEKRFKMRGRKGEAESSQMQNLYARAFDEIVPSLQCEVIQIDNSGPLEKTMQIVHASIAKKYAEWKRS